MIENKRVLITGGNRRIGLEVGVMLGKAGAKVAFTYRGDKSRAEDALSRLPANAVAIPTDLLKSDNAELLVLDAEKALGGPIDILINNAATFEDDSLDSVTPETMTPQIQVGLITPILITRYVTRHTHRDQMGLIINMLDYKIINPFPDYLSYSLAKFAMEGFTRLSARYLAPRWRVCGVAPGYTFKAPDEDPQHFAETRDKVPLGRGPRPEDIGEAIMFLANAPTITGQTLYLDSGAHMMAQERDFSITN